MRDGCESLEDLDNSISASENALMSVLTELLEKTSLVVDSDGSSREETGGAGVFLASVRLAEAFLCHRLVLVYSEGLSWQLFFFWVTLRLD